MSGPGAEVAAAEVDHTEAVGATDVLGSGTGLRFVLLLVLVTASTVLMMSDHIVLQHVAADRNNDVYGCSLAAGFDPAAEDPANRAALYGRNADALARCSAPFLPPWWWTPAVVATVFVLAAALCWATPRWTMRRHLLRPVDEASEAGAALRGLARRAEVPSARFVADWTSPSLNAVAFGRPGRAWVCLPAGLLQIRTARPDHFVAIVLHELAHLRHRDVGITYATVALWRVFVVTMLLPYLARGVELLATGSFRRADAYADALFARAGPEYLRNIALCLFTVLLVYLSRSDILRTRELYADRRAVSAGASRTVWEAAAGRSRNGARGGRIRSAVFGHFTTHPSWVLRSRVLADPAALLQIPVLPTFLTGATAALISGDLRSVWGTAFSSPRGIVGPALAGALVAGTTYWMIWRRTAHATAVGRETSSGGRTGFWLAAGLLSGTLLADRPWPVGTLFPSAPWLMILVGLLVLGVTCWTAQCARLLTEPASTVRTTALLGLVGAAAVLAFWLSWWQTIRGLVEPEAIAELLDSVLPADRSRAASVVAAKVLVNTTLGPRVVWMSALLWVVPLLAWARSGANARSTRSELPSLRRLLAAATTAALVSVVLAAVTFRVAVRSVDGTDTVAVLAFYHVVLVALLVGPLGAAVLATAVTTGRHRTLVGAVVAGLTAVLCSVGLVLLTFGLGCVRPGVAGATCGAVVPGTWAFVVNLILDLVGPGVVVAVAAAFAVSTVATAVRRGTSRVRPSVARPVVPPASPAPGRRITVAGIVVVAVVVNLLASTSSLVGHALPPRSADPDRLSIPPAPATQHARRAQIVAWFHYGGAALVAGLGPPAKQIGEGLRPTDDGRVTSSALVRSGCSQFGRWAVDAGAYFTVPDPQQQAVWEQAQSAIAAGSAGCLAALDSRNGDALLVAVNRMTVGGAQATGVVEWMGDHA